MTHSAGSYITRRSTTLPSLRLLLAGVTRHHVGIAPTGNRRLCTAHGFLTLRGSDLEVCAGCPEKVNFTDTDAENQ